MRGDLQRLARRLYNERRSRDELFGVDRIGFGEPAWDMLLLLAAYDDGEGSMPAARLMGACGVGEDIGSRYLKWLQVKRYVDTEAGDSISLSARGRETLTNFLLMCGSH